eukprot:TRINITY_DN2089_c0_g3_i1.p1 TRINITY_DN2089_c0_g3~~TRINITY_DN2089_c0_g3_i1.p1  ORF type:complete len:218 (+),score=-18.61 TRINITY_DN2089_c0_g3_i1:648-1301(+)
MVNLCESFLAFHKDKYVSFCNNQTISFKHNLNHTSNIIFNYFQNIISSSYRLRYKINITNLEKYQYITKEPPIPQVNLNPTYTFLLLTTCYLAKQCTQKGEPSIQRAAYYKYHYYAYEKGAVLQILIAVITKVIFQLNQLLTYQFLTFPHTHYLFQVSFYFYRARKYSQQDQGQINKKRYHHTNTKIATGIVMNKFPLETIQKKPIPHTPDNTIVYG